MLRAARGWTARQVALTCYALTAGLVMAGWTTIRLRFPEAIVAGALIGIAMLMTSVRMGALRSDSSRNKRAQEDLRWREMADHGLREKV